MSPMIFLVVPAFVIILVWVFVVAPQEQKNRMSREPIKPEWEAINDTQVQAALGSNNKIEAIKRYRMLTGLGLKESKDAIDYAVAHPDEAGEKKKKAAYDAQDAGIRDLVQDGRIDEAIDVYRKFAGVDEYTAKDAVAEIERQIRLGDEPGRGIDENHLLELLAHGNKIEAIKLYRAATGTGLQDAKNAVEALEKRRG